ncbi:MAG: hypothetical protein LW875_07485 [Proteobacteria bacterium]|jgi:hypothetical protein|nr:hypothetical protein [Pseudomonadota bacterium]
MSKFSCGIEKTGSVFQVKISGVIDEDADFVPYDLGGATEVSVDCSGVKGINSCGIREWIKWISAASGKKVIYRQCPKVIVDQINMVQGFLPSSGFVESFFVPYFHEDSGHEKNVLFSLGKEYTSQGEIKAPQVQDDSGNEMEMDVIEAKYFKFLKK